MPIDTSNGLAVIPAGMKNDTIGIMGRNDIHRVVRYKKEFWMQSPQDEPRPIEADILLRAYVRADGMPIYLAEIPEAEAVAA